MRLTKSISFRYSIFFSCIVTLIFFFLVWAIFYPKNVIGIADIAIFLIICFVLSFLLVFLVTYQTLEKPLNSIVQQVQEDHLIHQGITKEKELSMQVLTTTNTLLNELITCKDKIEKLAQNIEQEQPKQALPSEEYLINTEKLASLGQMTAGIVHEINSPLTGIITFAHLMLKRMPQDRVEDIEDLKVIISQAERCSRFVSGLLSFSRQRFSQKNKVKINTLLEDTLSIIKNQMKFQNVDFVIQTDDELPDVVIDENQIQQVFINILINAADAMNERGRITITTQQREINGVKYVEIAFEDTGAGLPKENLDKIFEPFFTTKPRGQGTGLGLAVSNNIIKKHGGYISVSSQEGMGATFFIGLPMQQNL